MLITLEETAALIKQGKALHIAGDETLLEKLPRGKWIGGTTPYFMGENGGVFTKERLFVTEMDFAEEVRIGVYGKYNIFQIVEECYDKKRRSTLTGRRTNTRSVFAAYRASDMRGP